MVSVLDADLDGDFEIQETDYIPEQVSFKLVGRTMLLMNSNAGVNPLHPLVKQKGILTSKKSKYRTDEDTNEIYRLDFELGMYYDEELGPYIPGVNVEGALVIAAQMERMGPKCIAGVMVLEDKLKLEYRGPRNLAEMWKSEKFADIRPTKLRKTSSLMKCRPCFQPGWSISGTLQYNGAIVDRAAAIRWLKNVGSVGLCDYRKRYGKSVVYIGE